MSLHAYRPVDVEMPHVRESAEWGTDLDSGAIVTRLTSGVAMANNIYCEQPYCSPDGRRLVIYRTMDQLQEHCQLLVVDLVGRDTTLVEADVPTEWVAHSSWGEWFYYVMHDGSLRRCSLMTLKREEVLPAGSMPRQAGYHLQSITPDNQWLHGFVRSGAGHLTSKVLNLSSGEERVLLDGADNLNPHGQMALAGPPRLLYQLIRRAPGGGGPVRVPVFVRDIEGGPATQLPFGEPWSAESSGHMAWIADTGRIACVVNWNRPGKCHDPRHPSGNLLIAAPGDSQPSVFPAPDCGFYHVSISRCGRYFVCDDFMHWRATGQTDLKPGPTRIVIGNLGTGKYRVLLKDCQNFGTAGSSRYEPNPYFTADNRYVIYNSSPLGTLQVFAARVPAEFLESLQ